MFKRPVYSIIAKRLSEKRRFIQVLAGPRQTGKTTLARQIIKAGIREAYYASADEPALKSVTWLEQQWQTARFHAQNKPVLLVLDEIQKITGWSETVKRLWDEDTAQELPVYCILLGSSPLLMSKGLSESLAGRFEIIPITHWSFAEMRQAFNLTLDEFIYYGGYPGAAELIKEPERWRQYILESLVETTISRDILLMTRVDKPALLRRLFELGCHYSGQVLSYQKMLGQLHDAGNTTTLAHYLDILNNAGLLTGLAKYAGQQLRRRASSPKLQVFNTALLAVFAHHNFNETRQNPQLWGRFVESAIGAYLANCTRQTNIKLFYWSGKNREVDFILAKGSKLVAIEVKSHLKKTTLPGIEAFAKEFPVYKKLLVGGDGIPVIDFLQTKINYWF